MEKAAAVTVCLLWLLLLLVASTLGTTQQQIVSSALAFSSANAAENSWTSKAPMHQARAYLGVAVVKGKMYAIGGDKGTLTGNLIPKYGRTLIVVNTNEEYDLVTDTWTFKVPMPTPRASFGIAVYQDKIYCIGGYTNSGDITGVNEVYDPATDTWETRTSMPTPRCFLMANVVDGKIYLIGGSGSSFLNVNEVYDPATDSWTTKTPIPIAVGLYASVSVDNKIYVMEGIPNPETYNFRSSSNQIYDPKTDSWSSGTPPPIGFYAVAAGVTSGVMAPKRIYVFEDNKTHIYDPANDSWTAGAAMPTKRACASCAVINDTFYVVGGRTGSEGYITWMEPSAVNEQYTPDTTLPTVSIFSPENKTYTVNNISLTFTVNEAMSWIGYSLDGQANVTITGNTTIAGLSSGLHNITVYATDKFGITGTSETIYFNIKIQQSEPFPTWIVAATVIIVVVGAAPLVYFRKIKKTTGKVEK